MDQVTFSQELTYCDGQSVVTTQCLIPAAVLNASPFDLTWGSDVYAKITATNLYGDSFVSLIGNGGTIVTIPNKPINLIENYPDRTPTALGLQW